MDSLLHYLTEEIAFDADEGTSLPALKDLISRFYSSSSSSSTSSSSTSSTPQPSSSTRAQNVDDAFLTFVWNALVNEDDVRVGVLKKALKREEEEGEGLPVPPPLQDNDALPIPPPPPPPVPEDVPVEHPPTPAPETRDGEGMPAPPPKGKKKPPAPKPKASPKKGKGKKATASFASDVQVLEEEGEGLELETLRERYGEENLRVMVGEETAWAAITGSHAKISAITPQIYAVLKKIARGREYGTTAIRISKDMGIEPKSVFHCIKIPTGLGITKKIYDVDQGSRTNRIIHVRYLSLSPHWAAHIASEPADALPPAGGYEGQGNEGEEEDEEAGGGGREEMMTPIGAAYLANKDFVRKRVEKALGRRKGGWMPHHDIAGAIGLHNSTTSNLRRLNSILAEMASPSPSSLSWLPDGRATIEKVLVAKRKEGARETNVQGLRLIRGVKREEGEEGEGEGGEAEGKGKGRATSHANDADEEDNDNDEEQEEDDPSLYPVVGKPIERQVLELLMNADSRGMTGAELSLSLAHFSTRFLDVLLARLSRFPPPTHLLDHTLHSVTETVGRLKQTRWFSLVGYLGYRRKHGVPDEALEAEWAAKEEKLVALDLDGEEAEGGKGGWAEDKPWEGQYRNEGERRRRLERFETMAYMATGEGGPKKRVRVRGVEGRKDAKGGEEAKPRKKKEKKEKTVKEKTVKAKAKGKGKEKAANQDPLTPSTASANPADRTAAASSSSSSDSDSPPPQPKKPTGRPRKNPLPPGVTESPYMRKKREKLEDEERERKGLEPLVRGVVKKKKAANGEGEGRKRKRKSGLGSEIKRDGEGEGEAEQPVGEDTLFDVDPSASTSTSVIPAAADAPPPPKKRGRKKQGPLTAAAFAGVSAPAEAGAAGGEEGASTPAPVEKKKRGRPPKATGKEKEKDLVVDSEQTNAEAGPGPSSVAAALAATVEAEVSMEVEPAVATPAPKKRGRPPKKKVAIDDATPSASTSAAAAAAPSSTPAATPGPSRAAQALIARSSAAAPSSTPASPSSPSASASAPTPRKRRLEPYIEIEIQSTLKTKRAKIVAKSTPASEATAKEAAPPPLSAAAATPASAVAKETTTAAQFQPHPQLAVVETASSPGPSNGAATPRADGQATPRPLATHLQQEGTPSASQGLRSKRPSNRTVKTSKDNLAFLVRQRELIDYTTHVGGIWARQPHSTTYIRDFAKDVKGDSTTSQMDRAVFQQVLDNAVKREVLRKTVGTDRAGKRREIYYLPSLALDSDVAVEFLSNVPQTKQHSRWSESRALVEGLELDETTGDTVKRPRRGEGRVGDDGGEGALQGIRPPPPSESPEVVKDFFRNEATILGRSHGVKYGALARARQLHKWLASFVLNQPDDSPVIALSDAQGIVISQSDLLNSMPFSVFVRIIPLPVESTVLDAFLADEQNLQLPMKNLPAEIVKLVTPKSSKRKASMWKILETLVKLQILDQLVPAPSTTGVKAFVPPVRPREVTHWRFRTLVPIYAARRDSSRPASLMAVHTLSDSQAVATFWSELQDACDIHFRNIAFTPLQHPLFSDELQSLNNHFRKELCTRERWRDSYQLSNLQRSFLVSVHDHESTQTAVEEGADAPVDDEERSNDVERWADSLFAPVDVVVSYLESYAQKKLKQAAKRQGQGGGGRKRRKVVFFGEEGEEVEGDGEWEDLDEQGQPVDPNSALQRKVKGAAEQRERDWTVIVTRFKTDHGEPDLDVGIVDYLHRRFVDPRRQIDAVQLDFELRRLLPPPVEGAEPVGPPAQPLADGQAPLKTVVPLSLLNKARRVKDPYAVSRQPSIRKRVRAAPSKNVKRVAPPPRNKVEHKPFTQGDQTLFLDVPLPPRPHLEKGERLSRNFWTHDQDDLLLDAFAVLKARAHRIKQRMAYAAFEQLFKGHRSSTLANHVKRLVHKPDDASYHERLTRAWAVVYEEKKDELDDPNAASMGNFDLAACIRMLRSNVDKRAIRLERTLPEELPDPVSLPGDLTLLEHSYRVAPTESFVSHANKWDKVWSRLPIASNIRDDAAAGTPFAKVQVETKVKPLVIGREKERVAAALKVLLTTSDEKYVEEQGTALLKLFETYVDSVVKTLVDKSIIVRAHVEASRRLPGRNFSYHDRFFARFDNRIDMSRLSSASEFERGLHDDDSEGVFPLIPADGELMALFDLISDGKVECSIDTSTVTEKVSRFDDYLTRQANDDDIECTINVAPVGPLEDPSHPLPETLLSDSASDSQELLAEARKALVDLEEKEIAELALKIEQHLVDAGVEGVAVSQLSSLAPQPTLLTALALLTTPSTGSPLTFFAGSTRLVLVSSAFLSSWILELHSPPAPPAENVEGNLELALPTPPKRILPCVWIDLNGEVNVELWNRAAGWVKGELMRRAGITLPELVEKAAIRNLLTAIEVQRILETLLQAGKVTRRRAGVEGTIRKEALVDWAEDGWHIVGAFW